MSTSKLFSVIYIIILGGTIQAWKNAVAPDEVVSEQGQTATRESKPEWLDRALGKTDADDDLALQECSRKQKEAEDAEVAENQLFAILLRKLRSQSRPAVRPAPSSRSGSKESSKTATAKSSSECLTVANHG